MSWFVIKVYGNLYYNKYAGVDGAFVRDVAQATKYVSPDVAKADIERKNLEDAKILHVTIVEREL